MRPCHFDARYIRYTVHARMKRADAGRLAQPLIVDKPLSPRKTSDGSLCDATPLRLLALTSGATVPLAMAADLLSCDILYGFLALPARRRHAMGPSAEPHESPTASVIEAGGAAPTLEPNAIGLVRSTIFAMAGAAPVRPSRSPWPSSLPPAPTATILPVHRHHRRTAVHRAGVPPPEHVAAERGRHLRMGVAGVQPVRRIPCRLADAGRVHAVRPHRRHHDRAERARAARPISRTTSGPAR